MTVSEISDWRYNNSGINTGAKWTDSNLTVNRCYISKFSFLYKEYPTALNNLKHWSAKTLMHRLTDFYTLLVAIRTWYKTFFPLTLAICNFNRSTIEMFITIVRVICVCILNAIYAFKRSTLQVYDINTYE